MFTKSGGLKKIGIGLAIWGFVKTIWDTIGHIGNVQTLWDMISAAVQYWPSFLRGTLWIVTSWWFPLIASTICLLLWWFLSRAEKKRGFAAVTFEDAIIAPIEGHDGIQVLRHRGAAAKNEAISQQSTKEPQPIIVAIDELKSLLENGETLVGRFQEDPRKPSLDEVSDWRKRTRDCARQNTLSSVVTTADLLLFDRPWDEGKVRKAAETFVAYRCFAHNSADCAVFRYLWGNVERLKQLIAKIQAGVTTSPGTPLPSQIEAWEISYEQESEMLDILRDSPKAAVMIMSIHGDGVGIRYSRRLHQVLGATGMEVGVCVFGDPWKLPAGINLWASDSADSRQIGKLKNAIKATNMECGDARREPPAVNGSIQYGIALMVKSLQT